MKKLDTVLNRIEFFVMSVGMGIMVLFNFMNVVSRKLMPKTPFSYTEELVVLIFLWISMFGISYAFRRHSHTGLNLVTEHLPAAARILFVLFSMFCSAVFVGIIAYTGLELVQNHVKYAQILPSLRMPMAVQSLALPLGGVVVILSVLVSGFREIQDIRKGTEEA
ncbi:MAG: TRAP transporter small permease [Lachnospiraceae bacterium]|nr:TRAP transporter small permease [Lachnospiraceae bacterium]